MYIHYDCLPRVHRPVL